MKNNSRIKIFVFLVSIMMIYTTCVIPNGNVWEGSQGAEGLAIPSNLTASAMSPDSVYLSWDSVGGVETYAVYSGTRRNGEYDLIDLVDERYFADTSLNPATTYFYKVASVSADGTGPLSDPVQTRTLDAGAKSLLWPPSGVAAEALTPRSIRVSWNTVSDGRYNIYRAGSYSGEKTKLNTSPFEYAVTSYTDTGLTPSTDYYYFLRTLNDEDAEGPPSPGVRISTPSNIDPSMPIPANVTAVAEGYTAIRISWNAVAGAVEYNVYVSTTTSGTYTILTAAAGLSYLHDNLSPNTTRYYKLSAVAANERESNASVAISGSTKQIPVPTGLAAEALNYTEIRLSWNSIDDAVSYKVYGSSSENGSYTLIDEAGSASYTHSDLVQNKTYYYKVSAVVSVGEGGQSGPINGMPKQVSMPSGLSAVAESYTEIRISWNPVQDALSYKVYGSSSANGTYTLIDSVNSSPYIHGGLTQNTTWYYKVSALVSGIESGQSGPVNGSTKQIPVPTGLIAEAMSASEIRLLWNPVDDALSYKVYGSSSANGTYTLITSVNSASYTHDGLNQNTTYYYKVSAVVSVGEGGQSAAVNARTQKAPITPPGATLVQQLAYIRNAAGDGDVYNIVVNNDENIGPQTVSTMGRNITVNISSASPADVKTIQLEGQGYLFSVDTGITLKLQDIVLRGHSNNNRALVTVGAGSTLVLNSGAKITQNTNTSSIEGGGIYVNGGSLEMNDGSEISQNSVLPNQSHGGGILVNNQGNVLIRGGLISENRGGNSTWGYGGGISIRGNSTVNMSGGIIQKNSTQDHGGGVYVDNGSSFTKRAAQGSSTSGIIYGNSGDNANICYYTHADNGNAIYRNWGSSLRSRNTTLSGYEEITTLSDVGWE